jgi:hypothetical protein
MTLFRRLGPQGTTFTERLLRSMGFVLLIAGIGYLFWTNYERNLQRIGLQEAVHDRTGELSSEVRKEVWTFSRSMREHFGITVEVRIAQRELLAPESDGKTLFFGIVPSERRAVILFPPLMERSLDPGFVVYLKQDHFRPYWERENGWQEGLQDATALLWEQMRRMERADG